MKRLVFSAKARDDLLQVLRYIARDKRRQRYGLSISLKNSVSSWLAFPSLARSDKTLRPIFAYSASVDTESIFGT